MRLETTEKVNNRKVSIAIDVLLALMLGSTCFFVFTTMFGLKWPGNGIFSGSISGGLAGVWDKIADRLGNLDYVILPKYKASMSSGGSPVYGTALTMILAVFSVISYFIIKSRTRLLMLLFALPLAFVMLVYGLTPSVYAGAFFAAAVIIVLAVMCMDEDLDLKFFMVPAVMLLACILVLAVVDKTVSLKEPRDMANYANSLKEAVDRVRYGSDPLPSGDLGRISGKNLKASRGDIETVKQTLGQADSLYGQSSDGSYYYDPSTGTYIENNADDTAEDESEKDDKDSPGSKTALTVEMTSPESYYLRGFIGASYDKNKWSTLSNDTFYGMRDTVFWLNRRNFDGLSEMSRAASLGGAGSFAGTVDQTPAVTSLPEEPSYDSGDTGTPSVDMQTPSEDGSDLSSGDTGSDTPYKTFDYDEPDGEDDEEADGGSVGNTYNNDGADDEDTISTVGFIDAVYAEGEDQELGNRISIKVKDASRRFAFVPYELYLKPAKGNKARKSEMVLPKKTKNYGGSHLGTEGIFGRSSYSYTSDTNLTGSWTDAVGKLYTASSTQEIQDYFISESHYNVIQYENYLDLPDKYKQIFNMEVGAPGDLSEDHAEYKKTIDLISSYLSNNYVYSENFTRPTGKEDLVQKFIGSKSGCDIHFATLATLLFRYYGIPARYVEGYLVTPDMVGESSSDSYDAYDDMTDDTADEYSDADEPAEQTDQTTKTIDVPKAANHAWTEIYIDGFGWVPFEATPEYRGIMKEADMTIGLQNVDYEYTPPEPDEQEEIESDDSDDEEDDNIGRKLLTILWTLIILIIIAALLYIAFRYGRTIMEERRWKKAFADPDPKKGIKALYQYALMKKWKLSGIAEGLGLRASYSTETMMEGERKAMLSEFEKAKEQAKKDKAAEKAQSKQEKAEAKAEVKKEKAEAKAEAKKAKAEAKAAAQKEKAEAKAAAKQEKAEAKAAEEKAEIKAEAEQEKSE